jgi:hypothetical protein
MSATADWVIGILISAIVAMTGVMAYFYTRNRNRTKDMKEEIKDAKSEALERGNILGKIQALTDNVTALTLSINSKLAVIEDRAEIRNVNCSKHGERLVLVEQSVASSHKRLDEHVKLFSEIRKTLDEIRSNQKGGN